MTDQDAAPEPQPSTPSPTNPGRPTATDTDPATDSLGATGAGEPLVFPPRPDGVGDNVLPRCLRCGYVLKGLSTPQCPECGRAFNPRQLKSYNFAAPFMRWRYWMPGLTLAGVGGFLVFAVLLWQESYGFGLTVALPFAVGGIVGYGIDVKKPVAMIISTLLAFGFFTGVVFLSLQGGLCGLILALVFVSPIIAGTGMGWVLRFILKFTRFSQRHYLPMIALLMLPLAAAGIEWWIGYPTGVEAVTTTRVIPVSRARAWRELMFYEEVTHDPPWLARIGLPKPLYTKGDARHVGDIKTCVYDKGRLVKRVTRIVDEACLGFEVIEQVGVEDRSVRLTGGSFLFESHGPHATRVTLTTRYEPLLQARPIWRPIEQALTHALHSHVLEGIERQATRDRNLAQANGAGS